MTFLNNEVLDLTRGGVNFCFEENVSMSLFLNNTSRTSGGYVGRDKNFLLSFSESLNDASSLLDSQFTAE